MLIKQKLKKMEKNIKSNTKIDLKYKKLSQKLKIRRQKFKNNKNQEFTEDC